MLRNLSNAVRRHILTKGGDGLTILIVLVTIIHAATHSVPLGFVAFFLVALVLVAMRGPDDRFTRACQLIDIAMEMATEDERRLLVAFELADDETRRKALEAMQRVTNPVGLFDRGSSGD